MRDVRKIILFFLLILIVFSIGDQPGYQAQEEEPASSIFWSYILVIPDSEREPYVLSFPDFDEPISLIFPENSETYLFAPTTRPLRGAVYSVSPHTMSGGYDFGTGGASDVTNASYADVSDDIDESIDISFNLRSFIPEVDSLSVTRDISVFGQSDALIISNQNQSFTPNASEISNIQCGSTEILSVVAFDFNSGDTTNSSRPAFQILQLEETPIRFSIPTFVDDAPFTAFTNTRGPGNQRLSIQVYELPYITGDNDTQIFKFQNWERFADTEYTRLYRSLEINFGSRFYPVGATTGVDYPSGTVLSIPVQETTCRSFIQQGTPITIRQRDNQQVRSYTSEIVDSYDYPESEPDAPSQLFQHDPDMRGIISVTVSDVYADGWFCYMLSGNDTQLCIEAWRVDISA